MRNVQGILYIILYYIVFYIFYNLSITYREIFKSALVYLKSLCVNSIFCNYDL